MFDDLGRADLERLSRELEMQYQRDAMLAELLRPGNEAAFIYRYFRHRIDSDLQDFHFRLIDTALYAPRGMVLFPAGHGKTTLISEILPILEVCREPNIRIALIAKNDDEAAAIMGSIKAELETNDLLIEDFGPFLPEKDSGKPWQSTWISVHKRTRIQKSPTIAAFGSGAKNILGHRTDWVICDDVVTEKNSATLEQRRKMLEWFTTSVETSPEKRKGTYGRITVVGTMFHPQDLYNSVERKVNSAGESTYRFHREDAVRDEVAETTLWPERWSWLELMDMKYSVGTLSFNKRFRNKPVDESEQPFREEWIRGDEKHKGCLDKFRTVGQFEPDWKIVQSFDPAVGATHSAKFCGHLLIAADPIDKQVRRIVDINPAAMASIRLQMTLPQQVDVLIDQALKYPNMLLTVIETNSYQKGLEQAFLDRCSDLGITIPVSGHTTGINKLDPAIGISSLSQLVEQGNLRFPYGDERSRRKSEALIQEMLEYPFYAFSDLLMALWFGILRMNIAVPIYSSFNRLDPKSRYRPMRGKVKNPIYAARIIDPTPPHDETERIDALG